MKILKTLGLIVLFAIIAFLVLGLFAPKEATMERYTVIDASKDNIFPHLQYHEKRAAWYPWNKMDPNMKTTLTGEDGTVGAVSTWESEHPKVGAGSEKITVITPNDRIESELNFTVPQEGNGVGWFDLADAEKGTKVTWGMSFGVPYPFNAMLLFSDPANSEQGKEGLKAFDQGLADLKTLVENEVKKPVVDGYTINTIDFPAKSYLSVRQVIDMVGIAEYYTEHFTAISKACADNNIEIAGQPCGLVFKWDEESKTTDLAAGIPIKGTATLDDPKNMAVQNVPAAKALLVDYYGDYHESVKAHNAIDKHMKANNLRTVYPVIEEYITDPTTETNPEKWLTKVYYFFEPNPVAATE